MFDSNGRTSFITTAASLAKLASNNRIIETAGENKVVCREDIAAAVSGDELTITNSSGSAGGIAGSKWKRVK